MFNDIYNILNLKESQDLIFINPLDYTQANYTSTDRTPFVYLLKWNKTDKHYIGSRYGKNVLPSSLLTSYFTSSSSVHEHISIYGLPDIALILNTFITPKDALTYETLLLCTNNASINPRFLNKTNGDNTFHNIGITYSNKNREKMSRANKGKVLSDKTKFLIRKYHKNRPKTECPNCNGLFSAQAMAQYHGDKCTKLTGEKHNYTNTDIINAKRRSSFKKSPKFLCVYCNKEFYKGNFVKFHGDKCTKLTGEKHKTNYSPTKEQKQQISITVTNLPKKLCPHCLREFTPASFAHYHGDKCTKLTGVKHKPNHVKSK